MNGAVRLRYVLAENDPLLMGYDQDAWARILDYHARPLEPALAVVEAVRANTTVLLRTLADEAWLRAGRHSESGPYSVESWLRIYPTTSRDTRARSSGTWMRGGPACGRRKRYTPGPRSGARRGIVGRPRSPAA